ncbi:gluconate kinase [Pseudoclavibacter sp. AY1F1]|uniref:gluconokinase n=1 Tax=Pseudoclavibacter sp. AY1F1 TaxID=2080583 RepID=UPI000CE87861|nr:gluconokinase [Pseudoclavibacter sp. AY1F1]PPF45586.1 gluconate kinase [Pseudoclavibacter sp. AY1F1]
MGVSGCGKTTIGSALAAALGSTFVDADALHPAGNLAKMAEGTPLTDEDRWPWLDAVGSALSAGEVVVACSALRWSYRERLCAAAPDVSFVHLHGPVELLRERMSARRDHFMPTLLLDSQLATLEPLLRSERGTVVSLEPPIDEIVSTTLAFLRGNDGSTPLPQTPIGASR